MSDWLNPVDGGSGGELTYPLTDQQMRYDNVRHKKRLNKSPEKPYVARVFGTFYLSENCDKNARNRAKISAKSKTKKREKPRKHSVFKAFCWRRKRDSNPRAFWANGFQGV